VKALRWETVDGYYSLIGQEPFAAYCSTKLGYPPVDAPLFLEQVHSGMIQVAPVPRGTPGDGWVTDKPGLWVAVKSADCCPVFLLDPTNRALGLAHAGWRGALARVQLNALGLMAQLYGTQPGDLLVAFGPCVCGRCYLVGEDVAGLFPGFAEKTPCGFRLDLAAFLASGLREQGVSPENIVASPSCTMEDPNLWSARRDGYRGRIWSMASVRA